MAKISFGVHAIQLNMNGQMSLYQAYKEIPIITRCYTTAYVLSALAVQLGFISPYQLYFNPKLVFHHFQIWRLVTAFLYFGEIDFTFILNLHFLYRYSLMLEEGSFRGRPADYLYMFIFGATSLIIIAFFVNLLFLGHALTTMLMYIWARRNPFARMDLFGLAQLHAPFFPFFFLLMGLLINSDTLVDIMGIAVGHVYYFLEDVLPNLAGGIHVLKTPAFLKYLFESEEPSGQIPEGFEWEQQPRPRANGAEAPPAQPPPPTQQPEQHAHID